MNVLILGSGGREHAFALSISKSKQLQNLYVAPGNAGTATVATNLSIAVTDFEAIKAAVISHNIELVLVGPEVPLVKGIHDYFLADEALQNVAIIGPQKLAATLEGSKDFAKAFMQRHDIPTAKYQSFTQKTLEQGLAFLETMQAPYVLKADGLAAGKGVLIIDNLPEAKKELEAMLTGKFGEASATVVIEEFLSGIELSCFVLTDGENYKILPFAKDYKRIGEGDTGLNTGGMGAVSPVPFVDQEFKNKITQQIVEPTVKGLQIDKIPYQGFIFIGLIKVNGEPKVIEYNVRMGDPETEVVLPRIKTDMLGLLMATANGNLDKVNLEIDKQAATTVIAVSGGYPQAYEKGKAISGLHSTNKVTVFHAGTVSSNNEVITSGGRVLAITALASNYKLALEKSYQNLEKIDFEGMYYRKDIGFDL